MKKTYLTSFLIGNGFICLSQSITDTIKYQGKNIAIIKIDTTNTAKVEINHYENGAENLTKALDIWEKSATAFNTQISYESMYLTIYGIIIAVVTIYAGYYIQKKFQSFEELKIQMENFKIEAEKKANEIKREHDYLEINLKTLKSKIIEELEHPSHLEEIINNVYPTIERKIVENKLLTEDDKLVMGLMHYNNGIKNVLSQNSTEAQLSFSRSIKFLEDVSNEYPKIEFYLGLVYDDMEEFDKAIHYYTSAILEETGKSKGLAYSNRGLTYIEIDEPKKASDDFKKSLMINPDDPIPYCALAYLATTESEKIKFKKEALNWFEGKWNKVIESHWQKNYSKKQYLKLMESLN